MNEWKVIEEQHIGANAKAEWRTWASLLLVYFADSGLEPGFYKVLWSLSKVCAVPQVASHLVEE